MLDLKEFAGLHGSEGKRQTEKKAALYAVRQTLGDNSVEISYEPSGKPCLSIGPQISISHSYDKLAVLFSEGNQAVGVDIEMVRGKILKIKEKFLSLSELKELEQAPLEKTTLYWAAKEAIYKAAGLEGLLFAEEILIHPFEYSEKGGTLLAQVKRSGSEKKYTLHYKILNDYVLVYTDNCE